MSHPRFLLDAGFVEHLATVDSSYGECARDGRLAVFIDYRRGVPLSVQVVRMPGPVSFKLHVMTPQVIDSSDTMVK